MIIANLSDGRTLRFDPTKPPDLQSLHHLAETDSISALSLYVEAKQHTLTKPKRFKSVLFSADLISGKDGGVLGERISVQADDVRTTVQILYGSDRVKIDLVRVGKMRYNPNSRR